MSEISRRIKVALIDGEADGEKCQFTHIVAELVIEENDETRYCTETFFQEYGEYEYLVTEESIFEYLTQGNGSCPEDILENAIVQYTSEMDDDPDYLEELQELNEMIDNLIDEEGIDLDDDGIIMVED